MDVREAVDYRTWKVGVELKLGKFQLDQSNKGSILPFQRMTTTTPTRACQDGVATTIPGAKGWEQPELEITLPGIVKIENQHSCPQQLRQKSETSPQRTTIQPTQKTTTPNPDTIDKESKRSHHQQIWLESTDMPKPTNIEPTLKKSVQAIGPTALSRAETFMQSRPGGPLETKGNEMKGAERRVSAQLQKKGTTSAEGRKALNGITTIMANENKENQVPDPSTVKKRKEPGERATLITPTKKKAKGVKKRAAGKHKTVKSGVAIDNKAKTSVVRCEYGCKHGGLIELVQMIPKWTKYHLEKGNYFHKKHCKDCKESIGDMFGESTGKGIFYYCHMDNKVADLSFDDQEKGTTACACILCIPCYYKREEKKKMVSGKSTRSSGRGRG